MSLTSPSQLDMNNPGGWPVVYKVLLWLVMLAAIFYLFYAFVVKGLLEQQEANDRVINEKRDRVTTLLQYTADLVEYKKRNALLLERLEGLLEYLPAQEQIASLIDDVYATASDSGISLNGFRPDPNYVVEEFYDIAPIHLNTVTYFRNFSQFSEGLTHLQQIMNTSSFTLDILRLSNQRRNNQNDDVYNENALVVESEMQTYIYNQDIEALREALRQGKLPAEETSRK